MPSEEQHSEDAEAAWGYSSPGESRWPATLALVVALVIYIRLPDKLTPGPQILVPALEVALLVPLVINSPNRITHRSISLRWISIVLIGVINAANAASLILLVRFLLRGGQANGRALIRAGIGIWVTQVLVFALWYWEFDRGGPALRCSPDHGPPDLLFPQMELRAATTGRWYPTFWDYLYVSLTNSTAFSPTDTMPLTSTAKMLMGAQSLVSLTTIAIVGSRAVNILT
ncbi:MAG: DUF1345 domain-containing protein [Actinomycetota bacterium]|nr:DUF1345 domain-containing protein [Actinomycetota bacterium]